MPATPAPTPFSCGSGGVIQEADTAPVTINVLDESTASNNTNNLSNYFGTTSEESVFDMIDSLSTDGNLKPTGVSPGLWPLSQASTTSASVASPSAINATSATQTPIMEFPSGASTLCSSSGQTLEENSQFNVPLGASSPCPNAHQPAISVSMENKSFQYCEKDIAALRIYLEGVCIAKKVIEYVLDRVAATDVLKDTKSWVCNDIFRKRSLSAADKEEVKPEMTKKKKKDLKPFIGNVQLKYKPPMYCTPLEDEVPPIIQTYENSYELLRNKTEECEAHERETSALKISLNISNSRLEVSSKNLAAMSEKADDSERKCQLLESRLVNQENKVVSLESQLMDTEKKLNEANESIKTFEFELNQVKDKSIKMANAQEEKIKVVNEDLKLAKVAGDSAEFKALELINKVNMLTRELDAAKRTLEERTIAFNNFREELEKEVRELVNF